MYTVLCCGSNGSSQLGVGHEKDLNVLSAAKFLYDGKTSSESPTRPRSIVCGGNHTLILFENQQVFAAGDNSSGQCGFETDTPSLSVFTRLPGEWKYVAAGWEYTVLVNTQNEVYVCGKGPKGELGLGSSSLANEGPVKIDFSFPEIANVHAGLGHTVVTTKEGLYGWGTSRQGQLGEVGKLHTGKTVPFIASPQLLRFSSVKNDNIKQTALGRDCTTILHANTAETFGKNAGTISVLSENAYLHSMWSSIHILEEDTVQSYGNNSHGQLMPKISLKVTSGDISVGSEHGLLRQNGAVFAWGWGEHGNCGIHSKKTAKGESDVTFDYLNCIYEGTDGVVMISGGCATSWVVLKR